jgi:hypothetical protein
LSKEESLESIESLGPGEEGEKCAGDNSGRPRLQREEREESALKF